MAAFIFHKQVKSGLKSIFGGPDYPDASLQGSIGDILGAFNPETIASLGNLTRLGLQQDLLTSQQYGSQFADERRRLMNEDPLIRRLRGIAISGLKDVQGGGLPGDIQKSILDRVRTSQAARGFEDSPGSIAAEAAALTGGAEAFRQTRLNQALAVGNQYAAPGQMLSGGIPSVSQMFNLQQNTLGLQNQQAQGDYNARMQNVQLGGQALGTIAGGLFGGGGGLGVSALGNGLGSSGSQAFGTMGPSAPPWWAYLPNATGQLSAAY